MRTFPLLTLVLSLSYSWLSAADTQAPPFDLGKVEQMKHFVGSDAARKLLAKQGFVVTDQPFNQIFEAYISCSLPKFITTDSAWHTYHVLLEEGVRVMAEGEAARLREFSERLVAAALKASDGKQDAHLDLARFAGVGLALQDEGAIEMLDARIKADVQVVVRKLKTGGEPCRVLFFGLPLPAQSFAAAGFYVKSEALRAYFAARQWYAVCAFRVNSREEAERAFRLALLVERDPELRKLYAQLSEPYDRLVGPCEDADARTYAALEKKVSGEGGGEVAGRLEALVAEARKLPPPLVNDQILTPEQYANFGDEIKGFRLLPPRRLPSAAIFQNAVDPVVKGRMRPSGVDLLATGVLASDAGRNALRLLVQDAETARAIAAAQEGPVPDSLHGQALRLLTELTKPLPDAAPPALRTPAWQDKQLWTQLGAWAEERHTWVLNTKRTVHYLGRTHENPGLVEPYPRFFSGLSKLAQSAAEIVRNAAPPVAPDPRVVGRSLLDRLALVEKLRGEGPEPTEMEIRKMEDLQEFLEGYFAKRKVTSEAAFQKELRNLRQMAGKWMEGGELTEEDKAVMRLARGPFVDLPALLADFAKLCDRLAEIAGKQLTGVKLDKEDGKLIEEYGKTLGRFHFYGGNSWLTPRDDFPLVAPVFSSPIRDEVLYAGLSRPEALYVIAEFEGKPVLYRGAVLSYREFARPAAKPLDDEAWKEEVRSGAIPSPPAFTQSFRATITEDEVVGMISAGKAYEAIDHVSGRKITRAMIEQLLTGKAPQAAWLGAHLRGRVEAEDVGDLIRILTLTDPIQVDNIAFCIRSLPWKPHREALVTLLSHEKPQYADAAAYVLAHRPGDLDVPALLQAYPRQSTRTKRLYCFLFGQMKEPGKDVVDLLTQTLAEADVGLRFEAVRACGRARLREPVLIARLIERVNDPNEVIAAEAADVLAALGVKEAASTMLDRLKKGFPLLPSNLMMPAFSDQQKAVFEGTGYTGSCAIMVLADQERIGGAEWRDLGRSLIRGLGSLAYAPAKKHLDTLIVSEQGVLVLEALGNIDPVGHLDRLLRVASNKEVPVTIREGALRQTANVLNAERVRRLLPLLDDDSFTTRSHAMEPWRICDAAADAIAGLLKWEETISVQTDRKTKDAFISKIKAWGASKTHGRP